MSLNLQQIYRVPEETARVARAVFPKGHPYMQVYDTLGTIFHKQGFAALFPCNGQPAEAPVRLASEAWSLDSPIEDDEVLPQEEAFHD